MVHLHLQFTSILCTLLYSITFLKFSLGSNTLFPNQTISSRQTLISPNQIFELGFFYAGKSRNSYLGIWYRNTPEVVVWVANRNNPITDSAGLILSLSRNGTLLIISNGIIIWSANPSRPASNPILQLLDNGNLILANQTSYIWQSFDYPTDTWLPGMKMVDDTETGLEKYLTSWKNNDDPAPGGFVFKIENQGLPELAVYKGTKKNYRTGKWNGMYFSGLPRFPNRVFKPELVFRGETLLSISEPFDESMISRVTLEASGSLMKYNMNERKERWNHVRSSPRYPCDQYGQCGPYGVCKVDKALSCECFKGFKPRFEKDWELNDWSGGCIRVAELNCSSGDDFVEVRGVKYPDMVQFWLHNSMSLGECRDECLRNCNCSAYANPYITNGGSGCLMWFGDLIDATKSPGPDSKQNIYIRLSVSEINSSSSIVEEKKEKKEKKRPTKQIFISIASGVLVTVLIHGGIFLTTRRKRPADGNEDLELPLFNLATVVAATKGFSKENIIGEGGFGPVYRGNLSAEEKIAVKRLSRTSGQGREEFKNEVISIAKLQHRNLVRLLGCCVEGGERMLIYEYMQNKSLDHFVFDENRKKLLSWPKRFSIIMGIGKGLLYLHHDSRLKVIHRDLKTSNILLDEKLNPKISDFGLARIFGENQSIARTKRVVGTYGYMAPEYAIDGKFSVKSDIFSFGAVLLEIVSGKKNRGFDHCDHHHTLLGHAWLLWRENRIMELMDECLKNTFNESQVKRCVQVGLLCVQRFAEDRPIMSSALFMLATDGAILPEPKEPGFFMERSSNGVGSCTLTIKKSEKSETMTITDLEAR